MVEREFEVVLDGKFSKRHLLAIIFEFTGITVKEADRRLLVGTEQIHIWCRELLNEGLIEYPVDDGDEAELTLTKAGFKILKIIEKDWIAKERREEAKVAPKKAKSDTKAQMAALKKSFEDNGVEIIIIFSAILSIYLIKLFLENPNVQGGSFVGGSVALSVSLVMYSRYQKHMRSTKQIISFGQWIQKNIHSMEKSLAFMMVGLGMIYTIGMLVLHFMGIFFLSSFSFNLLVISTILLAATTELVYYPNKTVHIVGRFYAGITLMVVGLMIVVDMINITEGLFGSRQRIIDLIFGIGFLILAHLNEKRFGVSKIIKKARLQREKEETGTEEVH